MTEKTQPYNEGGTRSALLALLSAIWGLFLTIYSVIYVSEIIKLCAIICLIIAFMTFVIGLRAKENKWMLGGAAAVIILSLMVLHWLIALIILLIIAVIVTFLSIFGVP